METAIQIKAQFWSFDVIFAIIIFSVAVTILALTWYSINNQLALAYGGGATIAQIQAQALAQQLLSPGYPYNWESDVNTSVPGSWANVSAGLTSSPGSYNISMSKVYSLIAMNSTNYQDTKQLLGVGFDYYLEIIGQSVDIEIGKNPATSGAVSEYVQQRFAYIDGNPVVIRVTVWTSGLIAVS